MLSQNFNRQLAIGRVGESAIARWLMMRGWSVLPVYEIEIPTGKGPRLFAPNGRQWAAPDMLVYKANNTMWIEAKNKSAFSRHRITGRWVTGIDMRHYDHYCAIEDASPWPVWLMFLQHGGQAKDSPAASPSGLFGNELKILRQSENHRHGNWGSGGMVYWGVQSLRHLADLQSLGIED